MVNKVKEIQDRSRCFTLIELLVVISIIAILASMLLPALSRARYQAKNLICIANQKQIAMGVLMYTDEYDSCYPTRSDSTTAEAADVVQREASTTRYLTQLRPYFSGGLKGTWVCPLAPPQFQKGGGVWYSRVRNLDQDTDKTMTSYAHYYGRTKMTGDPSYQGSGWGTGRFGPKVPMLKSGQPFVIDEYWSVDVAEFNVLTSDSMWLWNSGTLVYTHQSFIQPPGIDWNDQYGRIKINPAIPTLSMNYATDDGAVNSIKQIRAYSRNITLTRKGGSWGWAYMLPPPE